MDESRNDNSDTADLPPDAAESGLPERIGQYTIKRVIASGGMGTVYEALQEKPRRPAAVKVIKHSMATASALRRFEREAQALARLHHPGIAQIYEAGTYLDAGVSLPFFALEYIPNARTIIDFAADLNCDLRARLELFVQVCEAVHYGHQRGIIHRDLKPGNILVDSEARVRIIDFGVARAIDADQEEAGHQTQVGQFVGTVQYMSPEQFDADPNDLDTRSDVYTLGVVLYELLAGQLPYDVAQSGVFEVARTVREEEPTPLGSVAAGTDNEIGLVVATALAKDREKRYQSANALAEDLRRYLRGEAVSAKPASLAYQWQVFARKNKTAVALATVAIALLVGGVITTSTLYFDIRTEREKSEQAARQAIATTEFLTNTLSAVVPPGFGDVRTIADLCDRASLDIDSAFPDAPATEADIRKIVGKIYSNMGHRAQAEQQLIKAHALRLGERGADDAQTLAALQDLNYFYRVYGPVTKAVQSCRTLLQQHSRLFGPDDERTYRARDAVIAALDDNKLFQEGEDLALVQVAAAERLYGTPSHEVNAARQYYTYFLTINGKLSQSLETAREVLASEVRLAGADSEFARGARTEYAAALLSDGQIGAAKELYNHRKAPASLGIEQEYQGSITNLDEGIKYLVFFETWCPFSERYIPEVEQITRQYGALGIDVLGLTRVNRSSSDAAVRQCIADNAVSFSVAKESGRLWNYFDAVGTPQTVILHEGEVIWEASGSSGYMSRILEGVLASR